MRNTRTFTAMWTIALAAGLVASAVAQGFGGGMMGGMRAPMVSNTMGLLMRPEVQTHLHLDLKQKNAIVDLQDQSRNEMRQRMTQQFQGMQNLSPQERQQRMQQMRGQMQAQMQAYQGEINEKVKAILRPEQLKRLHALDLQWRGPLALADPKVAEEAKIGPEHRAAVVRILADYQAQSQDVMRKAFEDMRANNPGGQPGGPPPNPADFQARFATIRQKTDALRKDAEEKALAALTPEEKAGWDAAQGEKFTFRKDIPAGPGGGPGRPGF